MSVLKRNAYFWPFIFFAAIVVYQIVLVLLNNAGLSYSLDDPYIHLALSENIAQGHYGINLHEFSAPSSSIIWPFLLAPFNFLVLHEAMPLIYNILAGVGTFFIIAHFVNRYFAVSEPKLAANQTLLVLALMLVSNLLGVMFMGMEHGLQIMLAGVLAYGLIRENQEDRCHWWLLAAVICAPLVRYECLALSVPACAYLFWRGHRLQAMAAMGAIIALVGAFSLFLISHGQPGLPSSVLAKAPSVLVNGGALIKLARGFIVGLGSTNGRMVSISLILFAMFFLYSKASLKEKALGGIVFVAITLHLTFGRFGMLARYDSYLIIFTVMIGCYLLRQKLTEMLNGKISSLILFLLVFVGIIGFACLRLLVVTPLATNNIYDQQYQMHRFATEYYKAPVAVNDLGWVSYRNPNYVLDLWGLGSQRALELRQEAENTDWMHALAVEKEVGLIMIYRHWFGPRPKEWTYLGDLVLTETRITPAGSHVSFFVIDNMYLQKAADALEAFVPTLPDGAEFYYNGAVFNN